MFPWFKTYLKCPKIFPCNECIYVQKYVHECEENFDFTEDNELTFSSSFFHARSVVNVETIEKMFKKKNLHKVQKKETFSYQEYDKDNTVQHKKKENASPAMMDTCEEDDKN